MSNGLFEVLAHDDSQEHVVANRAVIAAQTRVQDRFEKFVANSANDEDRVARIGLLEDEIREVVSAVADEYGYEGDPDTLYLASTAVLGGGHASDCSCGFCENKGKLPGAKDESEEEGEEDSTKESSVKRACSCCKDCGTKACDCDNHKESKVAADYPGHDYSIEGGEYVKNYSPEDDQTADASKDESDKEAWHKARVAAEVCHECHHPLDAHQASGQDGKKGCDYCDCKREAGDLEQTGTYSHRVAAVQDASLFEFVPPELEAHTAAGPETGDTFTTDTLDLGSSSGENGVQDVGSPKIDKKKVPGDGLSAIDVPSKQHPTETQDIHDTPDYWDALPGPSETGKSIDADKPLAPEFYSAPNTDTWTGTSGLADPVTQQASNVFSARVAKWELIS